MAKILLEKVIDELPGWLRDAVRRPDLWWLAPNPLLLTVMALVHTHKGRLPDARALLYEETVDILLWRWEQLKGGAEEESPRLPQLLLEAGRSDVDLKRVLWGLAFQAHREGRWSPTTPLDGPEMRCAHGWAAEATSKESQRGLFPAAGRSSIPGEYKTGSPPGHFALRRSRDSGGSRWAADKRMVWGATHPLIRCTSVAAKHRAAADGSG